MNKLNRSLEGVIAVCTRTLLATKTNGGERFVFVHLCKRANGGVGC